MDWGPIRRLSDPNSIEGQTHSCRQSTGGDEIRVAGGDSSGGRPTVPSRMFIGSLAHFAVPNAVPSRPKPPQMAFAFSGQRTGAGPGRTGTRFNTATLDG